MTDIKNDGSGMKRNVVDVKNQKPAKVLPFGGVEDTDLKKIAEIGDVMENWMNNTGWQLADTYINSRNSSEALIQAKKNGGLDDLMSEIIGFRNFKSWIIQKIQEGTQAKEVMEIRMNLKQEELQRKDKREVKPE